MTEVSDPRGAVEMCSCGNGNHDWRDCPSTAGGATPAADDDLCDPGTHTFLHGTCTGCGYTSAVAYYGAQIETSAGDGTGAAQTTTPAALEPHAYVRSGGDLFDADICSWGSKGKTRGIDWPCRRAADDPIHQTTTPADHVGIFDGPPLGEPNA